MIFNIFATKTNSLFRSVFPHERKQMIMLYKFMKRLLTSYGFLQKPLVPASLNEVTMEHIGSKLEKVRAR